MWITPTGRKHLHPKAVPSVFYGEELTDNDNRYRTILSYVCHNHTGTMVIIMNNKCWLIVLLNFCEVVFNNIVLFVTSRYLLPLGTCYL